MKKTFIIVSVLALILTLASCSSDPGSIDTNNKDRNGFYFVATAFGNAEIGIDDDMADVLAKLGEPLKYFEAASCAFKGLDKTYTYSGFIITTRPEGDKDFVNSILLTDDSVSTPEGIYIGCSKEKAIAAYPGCEVIDNVISVEKDGTAVNIILKDGAVISIEYIPA